MKKSSNCSDKYSLIDIWAWFYNDFFDSCVEVLSYTSNFEYNTNTEFSLSIFLVNWGSSFDNNEILTKV